MTLTRMITELDAKGKAATLARVKHEAMTYPWAYLVDGFISSLFYKIEGLDGLYRICVCHPVRRPCSCVIAYHDYPKRAHHHERVSESDIDIAMHVTAKFHESTFINHAEVLRMSKEAIESTVKAKK